MIKYIGSKRALVGLIADVAGRLPVNSAADLFAGTTRVGQALRRIGLPVVSNDLASYSEVLGQAFIAATEADLREARPLIEELGALPGRRGYFTERFCEEARYLQPANGARVDAIREAIEEMRLPPVLRGIVLTSLLLAADRVDSTTGLQMAYLKQWAPRSSKPLELRLPEVVPGPPGTVLRRDANDLAPDLEAELVYIDPPYNQHSYFSNYHVWETLIRWDRPESYGIARKRVDCRTTKSPYNSRRLAGAALEELLDRLRAPWLLVSFNDEGFHEPAQVASRLGERGYVSTLTVPFRRYVGAQIGIHSPAGEKVGTATHLRNAETLFLVGPKRGVVERAFDLAA